MRTASYVFYRKDTGTFFFRWVVPTKVRSALGGRREVKKSLHTDNRRIAVRLARRLSVLLERAVSQIMLSHLGNTEGPATYLTVKFIEYLADGLVRLEGVELDPKHVEEEQ